MPRFVLLALVSCTCSEQPTAQPHAGGENVAAENADDTRPALCVLQTVASDGSTTLRVERRFDAESRLVRETIEVRGSTSTTELVHEADGSFERRGRQLHRFEPSREEGSVRYTIFELHDGAEPFELGELVFRFGTDARIASMGESIDEFSRAAVCTYDEGNLVRRQEGEDGWDTQDVRYTWEGGRLITIEESEPDPNAQQMPGEATFVPVAKAELSTNSEVTTAAFRSFDSERGDFTGPPAWTTTVTAGCEAMLLGDCAHPLAPPSS